MEVQLKKCNHIIECDSADIIGMFMNSEYEVKYALGAYDRFDIALSKMLKNELQARVCHKAGAWKILSDEYGKKIRR